MSDFITVREVGLRDGLQMLPYQVETSTKLAWFRAEAACGVSAFEITSFVSRKAMPQFADAEIMAAETADMPGVRRAALALNGRGAERALEAGVDTLVFVISASEAHSKGNAGRSPEQALTELAPIMQQVQQLPATNRPHVLAGVATAFGCTLEGEVDARRVRQLMLAMAEMQPDEMALADTVGLAHPSQVKQLAGAVKRDIGNIPLSLHLHDTRGLGMANVMAGLEAGVTGFDAALGGLGGCPFAPGASGNIATEDLVYLLHTEGLRTGIDLPRLLEVRDKLHSWLPGTELYGAIARAGIPAHQRQAMST